MVCTPDHRFLTTTGKFQPVRDLEGKKISKLRSYYRQRVNPGIPRQNASIDAGFTSSAMGSGSRCRYGKPQTAHGLKASISTISTTTEATTSYQILKRSQEPNMGATIWRDGQNKAERFVTKFGHWPQLGTGARRGGNGTRSTMRTLRIVFRRDLRRSAISARKPFGSLA